MAEIFPVLFGALAFVVLISVVRSHFMRKYIQEAYPDLWKSFGFPASQSILVAAKDERKDAQASIRFLRFLYSTERKHLNDARLNAYVGQAGLCAALVVAMLCSCIVFLAIQFF